MKTAKQHSIPANNETKFRIDEVLRMRPYSRGPQAQLPLDAFAWHTTELSSASFSATISSGPRIFNSRACPLPLFRARRHLIANIQAVGEELLHCTQLLLNELHRIFTYKDRLDHQKSDSTNVPSGAALNPQRPPKWMADYGHCFRASFFFFNCMMDFARCAFAFKKTRKPLLTCHLLRFLLVLLVLLLNS